MNHDAPISELTLAQRAGRGDMCARKTIYTLHVRYLAAVCQRYVTNAEDARDVLQDSFIRIFSSLQDFKERSEGSLRRWMTRIVVNESLKFIRASRRIEFTDLNDTGDDPPDEEPPEGDIPADVIFEQIRLLPDGYRMIFNLYVIEGHSHKEIARMLNIKESTSASQLHRAKAMLAARLRKIQPLINPLKL